MMKEENGGTKPAGVSAPRRIEIVELRRVSQSQPTAWEGRTSDGWAAHVAYRYGRLTVELLVPTNGDQGRRAWIEGLRLRPSLMMAEIQAQEEWEGAGPDAGEDRLRMLREQHRAVAEEAITAEYRQANWSGWLDARGAWHGRGARIVTLHELRGWLSARSRWFTLLRRRGEAGGDVHVDVCTWNDGV